MTRALADTAAIEADTDRDQSSPPLSPTRLQSVDTATSILSMSIYTANDR